MLRWGSSQPEPLQQCQCSGRRCCGLCDPSSPLLDACPLLARQGGTCVGIARWASLPAFRWKRRHSGREGCVVQFHAFSGVDLWKTSVLCYKLVGKNRCSLTVRIQKYKERKIDSFQIGKSNSAGRMKIFITISIPLFFLLFLLLPSPIHRAPREGMIEKAQEFIGYLKADGK